MSILQVKISQVKTSKNTRHKI